MPIARKLAISTQPRALEISSQTSSEKKENPVPAQTFYRQNLSNQRQPIELVMDHSFGAPPAATIAIDSDTKMPDKKDFCWGKKYFRILYKGPTSRSLPLLGLTVTNTGFPGNARRIQTSKSVVHINSTPVYLFREILFRRPGAYQIRVFPWNVNRGDPTLLEISTVVKLRQTAMNQQKNNSSRQIPPIILVDSQDSGSEMRLPPNKQLQLNTCDKQCSINLVRLGSDTSLRHSSNSSQRGELGMIMAHRGQNNTSSHHGKSSSDSCGMIENIHPITTTTSTALPRPDSEPAAVVEIGTDTDARSGSCIDSVNSGSKKLFHISQGRENPRQTCTMASSIDQTLTLSENLDTFAQSNGNQSLLTPGATAKSIVESDDSADDGPQDWSVHDMFSFNFD